MEGQLERSPHSLKHIPRGELVELLSKSLLYLEVESHWKGDTLMSNCKSRFSLLEPHVCSVEPPKRNALLPPPASTDIVMKSPKTNGATVEAAGKRKTSPSAAMGDGPAEKRAKKDPDDMELDSSSECKPVQFLAFLRSRPPSSDSGHQSC